MLTEVCFMLCAILEVHVSNFCKLCDIGIIIYLLFSDDDTEAKKV